MPLHTRACVTATGAVLLDLKRNRYFGLGYREARTLSTLALNWSTATTQSGCVLDPMPTDDAARLADALVNAGFLTPIAPTDATVLKFLSIDSNAALTSVSYELQPAVRLHLYHVIAFVRACIWAKHAVDSRLLYSVALEVANHKLKASSAADIQQAIELVCIFRRLRPYAFAAKDQCLFHALALLKFLSHYNIFPTWVIAVRPTPWAAHSWLQLGSLVLDCNPEEISGYTPILAI